MKGAEMVDIIAFGQKYPLQETAGSFVISIVLIALLFLAQHIKSDNLRLGTVVALCFASVAQIRFGWALEYGARDVWLLLMAIAMFTLSFTVVLHGTFFAFGPVLTEKIGSAKWVKILDYLYIVGACFGLLKFTVSIAINGGKYQAIDNDGPIVLAAAIAIRITKTTIELMDWDKRTP